MLLHTTHIFAHRRGLTLTIKYAT